MFQFRLRRGIWFRSGMLQILHIIQRYCGDVAVTSETFHSKTFNNNNNNIYLKSSIQTSSIDYKKYNDIYN